MVFNNVELLQGKLGGGPNEYTDLRVLIIDDFDSFRLTVSQMLDEFGCKHVDTVMNGRRAIRACQETHFDIILCDYNLGPGPNGQQVLETIRVRKLLPRSSLFLLVSAESSKSIVLSAYDYEPDAYLTKPITAKGLKQRLDRLLRQRQDLRKINQCLDSGDTVGAIAAAREQIAAGSRHSALCQKLLGKLYLDSDRIDEAEELYKKVLEVRPLDWAQVGMSRVKKARGDLQTANEWLRKIIKDNPFCMIAYDELASNYHQQGNLEAMQKVLQQAVDVSPMSILRQNSLAEAADENNDYEAASKAYSRTVKLGEHSCHDKPETHLQFARTTAAWLRDDPSANTDIAREGLRVVDQLGKRFELKGEARTQAQLLECQLHTARGDKKKALEMLLTLEDRLDGQTPGLDLQLDRVAALRDLGRDDKVAELLQELVAEYRDDQTALERIDPWLDEPVSERNRKRVATLNNDGIQLYQAQDYPRAIESFSRACRHFPNHIGVHLNLAQALISDMKEFGASPESMESCLRTLQRVERQIKPGNPQTDRYRQLQQMLRSLS